MDILSDYENMVVTSGRENMKSSESEIAHTSKRHNDTEAFSHSIGTSSQENERMTLGI